MKSERCTELAVVLTFLSEAHTSKESELMKFLLDSSVLQLLICCNFIMTYTSRTVQSVLLLQEIRAGLSDFEVAEVAYCDFK